MSDHLLADSREFGSLYKTKYLTLMLMIPLALKSNNIRDFEETWCDRCLFTVFFTSSSAVIISSQLCQFTLIESEPPGTGPRNILYTLIK